MCILISPTTCWHMITIVVNNKIVAVSINLLIIFSLISYNYSYKSLLNTTNTIQNIITNYLLIYYQTLSKICISIIAFEFLLYNVQRFLCTYILFVSIIMNCDSFNIYKIDKACECIPNIYVLKIFEIIINDIQVVCGLPTSMGSRIVFFGYRTPTVVGDGREIPIPSLYILYYIYLDIITFHQELSVPNTAAGTLFLTSRPTQGVSSQQVGGYFQFFCPSAAQHAILILLLRITEKIPFFQINITQNINKRGSYDLSIVQTIQCYLSSTVENRTFWHHFGVAVSAWEYLSTAGGLLPAYQFFKKRFSFLESVY
ncbi:hypothetical protein AGLY_013011 [Aphis glycines]|uniref:Uncharacterized protein n=1 Tax=Aphis glycines TaxID=307491 RepID=A0A6G0T7U0_APHGL|nr:hypothetical protein AGLY_013011 [Aphis glycines]